MIATMLKRALRSVGVDARRYTPQSSEAAMLGRLFATYDVDCVFDVGASVGRYARGLRSCGFRGRIISFEPLSSAHALLVKNSRSDPNWIVAPAMALGAFGGDTQINISGMSDSSSILPMTELHQLAAPGSHYVGTENAVIRGLDSVFPEYVSDSVHPFLKIDTQGYELQVLDGAKACLSRFQGVQLEMSLSELYRGQKLLVDFVLRMRDEGFQLAALFPGFADNRTGRLLQVDGVFFR